ncbi:MAG: sulfatase-like hydrolase/transferase, partial [Paracoccaceae bacterium]
TPFKGEKNDNWEGGYRVPMMIKWPGVIEPGSRSNQIISHLDWFPTFMSANGDPNMKEKMLDGPQFGEGNEGVHLDGYDFMPFFRGETEEGPRKEFFYFSDGGDLVNLRYNRRKLVFAEQRTEGFNVWEEPFVPLRLPKLIDLYSDPFERAPEEASGYVQWRFERLYLLVPAQVYVGQFLETFAKYPPRQAPASFSIDQVLTSLQRNQGG